MNTMVLLVIIFLANVVNAKVPDILDASALKETINPCEDFYRFSCGTWLETTVIPKDKNRVYHSSDELGDEIELSLNKMLETISLGKGDLNLGASKQLGDYYASCMNYDNFSNESLNFLKNRMNEIDKISNLEEMAIRLAKMHREGSAGFFNLSSSQDLNDSSQVISAIYPGGMALPEPDFYFDKDKKSVEIRTKYLNHIKNIFVSLGFKSAKAKVIADTVFNIESRLAVKAFRLSDRYDPSKTNHPMDRSQLKVLLSNFNMDTYFAEADVPESKLNVSEPEYMKALNKIFKNTSLEKLKIYLTWQYVLSAASSVNSKLDREIFQFWKQTLHGDKEMKPRWKICTQQIQNVLGYALGEVYVSKIDTKTVRAKIEKFIELIKEAFRGDLKDLTNGKDAWMDEATMKQALEKLELLNQKIGSPDKWRDYSSLTLMRGSLLVNDSLIAQFERKRDLNKINKPVDKSEWYMMPWEINAYYDSSNNEFVFPFGILQPPSFDVNASDGANLGAFGGGTIGHELTHGYDNDGRQYDGQGNVKDWWTAETLKKFESRSACFVNQANKYLIKEVNLKVNGKSSLPENLADQGGVKLGYQALLKSLEKREEAQKWLNKYNEKQQFWIAYAQSWCTKRTPESLRNMILTNEHPPEEFRVNGVIMNRSEFASDFECKSGSKMVAKNICSLW